MPTREERRLIEKESKDAINRLKDKYSDVKHSLWNALITLNSLLLSCVSILFIINPTLNKTIVMFLFSFSLLAITGIIGNYLLTKSVYKRINGSDARFKEAVDANNFQEFQKKEKKYYVVNYKKVEIIEFCAIVFSAMSLIIIFLILIFSKQENTLNQSLEISNFFSIHNFT